MYKVKQYINEISYFEVLGYTEEIYNNKWYMYTCMYVCI